MKASCSGVRPIWRVGIGLISLIPLKNSDFGNRMACAGAFKKYLWLLCNYSIDFDVHSSYDSPFSLFEGASPRDETRGVRGAV
jgi:hypothetical protein